MPGLPRGLVNTPLEYFAKAVVWMRRQPGLGDGFLAMWGASRGGELALLLDSTFAEINAVVARAASGVVFWPLGLAEPGDTRPRHYGPFVASRYHICRQALRQSDLTLSWMVRIRSLTLRFISNTSK